ncbi:MAG: hypothetical protein D3917_19025 [Candidatus Electrothrix sp. AX5]|nr:hypothetical protein [Candidatus Electrothrix sp. AX5]
MDILEVGAWFGLRAVVGSASFRFAVIIPGFIEKCLGRRVAGGGEVTGGRPVSAGVVMQGQTHRSAPIIPSS